MKPDSSDQTKLRHTLRLQLILAQVRLMELEDELNSITSRLKESEELLQQAQTMADSKLAEAAHLGKTLAETQQNHDSLQALMVQGNQALAATRNALDLAQADKAKLEGETEQLANRLGRTRSELAAFKATRSWRWTAWLRTLAEKLNGKQT